MSNTQQWQNDDPLGLSELPLVEPETDGWDEIRAALESSQRQRSKRRLMVGWLAAAASLVLVVSVLLRTPGSEPLPTDLRPQNESTTAQAQITSNEPASIENLINMSQLLETQLRNLRSGSGGMPADSATYIAELEDLVAQVDEQLNFAPDSIDLWGQRVNLLLDLEQLYQHQWERVYGRMASL